MTLVIKTIVFILGSTGLVWLARSSFSKIRSHGFYRFFAFESILALFLLNLDYWLYDPFSIRQLVSWLLLFVSSYLVIHGVFLLRKVGKPDDSRSDPTLMSIEKTTNLVTEKVYRYIRHPLYSSLLFLVWGVFLKHPSGVSICLAVIATVFIILTAKKEETENIIYFGHEYTEYMKRTKMFVPFIY